jgi:hypothetical protein
VSGLVVATPAVTRVSASGGLPGCSAAPADGMPPGAVEPAVAADPREPSRVVAAWPQDAFRGVVTGFSDDGGTRWRRAVVPGLTRCTGGSFDHADNVSVVFPAPGVVLVSAHLFDGTGANTRSARVAVRSFDGGHDWGPVVTMVAEQDPAMGRFSGGTLVADHGVVFAVVPKFGTGSPTSQVWFAASPNGGQSWRPAREIADPGPNRIATGHQLLTLADNTVLDLFMVVDTNSSPPREEIDLIRSADRGATWSPPTLVTTVAPGAVRDPVSGQQVQTGSALSPGAAVDPVTGRIILVWQDSRWSDGRAFAIALSTSDDNGRHWTSPERVSRTPVDRQAFTPSITALPGGTVAIAYYDFRYYDGVSELSTDRWLLRRSDRRSNEIRLTPQSFDLRRAPLLQGVGPGGYFLGSTMGITPAGRDVLALYAQPLGDDPAAVLAARAGTRP